MDEYTLSQAVWARHKTLPTLTAYETVPSTRAQTYCVPYFDAGRAFTDRLGGGSTQITWGWYATIAGVVSRQVMDSVREYRSHFLWWRPDPSESATPVTEVDIGADITRDAAIPADVRFFTLLRFRLTTTRS